MIELNSMEIHPKKDVNNLIPSVSKKCSKCGRGDLPFMHPNYLCDYCFFGDSEKFPHKHEPVKNYITSILGGIFGIILLAILGYWIFSAISDKSNYNGSEKCEYGYHMEGYTTSYGETITECFKD